MKQKRATTKIYLWIMIWAVFFISFTSSYTSGAKEQKVVESNPFLVKWDTPFEVPPFDAIKVEHFLPAIKEGIRQQQEEIKAIVNNPDPPTFANTVAALEFSGALLDRAETIFNVLNSTMTNDDMQQVARESAPLIARHRDDVRLNEKLFQRLKAVFEQRNKLKLPVEQDKLLEDYYKEFVRGGANLPAEKQSQLRKINEELSLLTLKFGENILKEDNSFKMVIGKKEDLAGLPQWVIDTAAETAEKLGHKGKWVFTLHKPSMIPFLQYADNRALREKIFTAYITRGTHNNELDNKEIIKTIVRLRLEKANLLGYRSHAEYMLEKNMAKKPENVYRLLRQVWEPALKLAKKEARDLQAMIHQEGKNFKLQPWDWWYYAEKVRKARYDLDEETIKPYFKLENVRNGAFYVANKLYGIKFVERHNIPKYHQEVQVFEVQEADGSHLGIIYFDYFPRASKRSGAWMNEPRKQMKAGGKVIHPIVTNNGNFTRPTGDIPSLLSSEEVETLFHEFGHALHGLLSDCVYQRLSGSEVALDFVELPSQIMENWVFEPEVLKVYARHYKTGKVIPQDLIDKIKKSDLFNKGFETVELLAASFLDMDWHNMTDAKDIDVEKFETVSLNRIGLIPEIVVRYRSTYFRHIFSGQYSAGYYSYMWSEVLDADAFEAFKESSLFDLKTARSFRKNILERGGTEEPMTLYQRFRGREPRIEPLLKRRGIL